jgi:hypothetical protein
MVQYDPLNIEFPFHIACGVLGLFAAWLNLLEVDDTGLRPPILHSEFVPSHSAMRSYDIATMVLSELHYPIVYCHRLMETTDKIHNIKNPLTRINSDLSNHPSIALGEALHIALGNGIKNIA